MQASSESARSRMRNTPRRDTLAEMRIRKRLHAMGLRYSVDAKLQANMRRRADVVFKKARVAVFIDGCFWHGCPEHGTWPKANADFWREKILTNKRRDSDTDTILRRSGWEVLRIWEHEDPNAAAALIASRVRSRSI
jgi:DNA mismatch endonuclease, patch repair protein